MQPEETSDDASWLQVDQETLERKCSAVATPSDVVSGVHDFLEEDNEEEPMAPVAVDGATVAALLRGEPAPARPPDAEVMGVLRGLRDAAGAPAAASRRRGRTRTTKSKRTMSTRPSSRPSSPPPKWRSPSTGLTMMMSAGRRAIQPREEFAGERRGAGRGGARAAALLLNELGRAAGGRPRCVQCLACRSLASFARAAQVSGRCPTRMIWSEYAPQRAVGTSSE